MNKLSAIIITYNEQDMIEACLKSLVWVDEIVVIDSNSSDSTVNIGKKYTNNIYSRSWDGFAKQKNFAITKATGDWLLFVDADERISKSLAQEIHNVIQNDTSSNAFLLPRKNIFLGKFLSHGGWYPDNQVRLIRKKNAHFSEEDFIHETLQITDNLTQLTQPLYHLSHRTIESNLLKTIEYAKLNSHQLFIHHAPSVTRKNLFLQMVKHFFDRYIRAKGYKDGMEGFIESTYQAFSQIFIIQTMLWEKQRGDTKEIYQDIDKKILDGTYNEK